MVQASPALEAAKRLLSRPQTYAGAAVIAVVVASSMALGGFGGALCSESPAQVASRISELQKTYASVYQEAGADIQACQSLECERPAKLEIAGALRSYNEGLGHICWPTSDQSLVHALTAANSAEAVAYNNWADAASPADDQLQESRVLRSAESQQAAARAATTRLQP